MLAPASMVPRLRSSRASGGGDGGSAQHTEERKLNNATTSRAGRRLRMARRKHRSDGGGVTGGLPASFCAPRSMGDERSVPCEGELRRVESCFNVADDFRDRGPLTKILIRHVEIEHFLQCEDQLDRIGRIQAQIMPQRIFWFDVGDIHS